MTPEEARQLPRYQGNPLFKDLPDYVKDYKNYDKIQRALLETLATTHSHGEVTEWANCGPCTEKMLERRALMTKFGFTPQIYREWVKVQNHIQGIIPK